MSASETKTITAEVPAELLYQVEQYAALCQRSVDWVINESLSDWLRLEQEKAEFIREGLADIDAGRTVDHDEVRAWVDSLDTEHPLPMPVPKAG